MTEHNYLKRRVSRRTALRGAAVGAAGLAGAALIGCGDDDEEVAAPAAPAAATAAPKAAATAAPKAAATAAPKAAAPKPTASTKPAAGQIDSNAHLRVGFGSFASSLDISTAEGAGGQAATNTYTYGNLLAANPDGSAANGGMADFEWREDNYVLRFTLRDGIKFHNGNAFDAEQLKANFDRTMGYPPFEHFVGAWVKRNLWVGESTVVDPLTIDVRMIDEPFRNAPQESYTAPVDKTYVTPEGGPKGDENQAMRPISTGPMQFVSFTPDAEMVSTRFDGYPFPAYSPNTSNQTGSYVKDLTGKYIPEEQARFAALEAGEIDIAYRVGPDLAKAFAQKEGFQMIALPDVRVMSIEIPFNAELDYITGEPNPWRDLRVRQAANYAIDTDAIINNLLTGAEERAYSPFSRGGYPLPLGKLNGLPGNLEEPYKFDPKRARALLEEAGQIGFEIEILLAQGLWTADRLWMPAIQKMLNDVGFNCSVKYSPLSPALAAMRNRSHGGPHIFNQGSGSNGAGYKNADTAYGLITTLDAPYGHSNKGDTGTLPEFDVFQSKIEEARSYFDNKKRDDLFQEAAVIHYENAFNVSMFTMSHLYCAIDSIDYEEFFTNPTGMDLMNVKMLTT